VGHLSLATWQPSAEGVGTHRASVHVRGGGLRPQSDDGFTDSVTLLIPTASLSFISYASVSCAFAHATCVGSSMVLPSDHCDIIRHAPQTPPLPYAPDPRCLDGFTIGTGSDWYQAPPVYPKRGGFGSMYGISGICTGIHGSEYGRSSVCRTIGS
jgi:hypothetical protein